MDILFSALSAADLTEFSGPGSTMAWKNLGTAAGGGPCKSDQAAGGQPDHFY